MKLKISEHNELEEKVIYDGPALEHNYGERFRIVAGYSDDSTIYLTVDSDKHHIEIALDFSESTMMHQNLSDWICSISKEALTKIEKESDS